MRTNVFPSNEDYEYIIPINMWHLALIFFFDTSKFVLNSQTYNQLTPLIEIFQVLSMAPTPYLVNEMNSTKRAKYYIWHYISNYSVHGIMHAKTAWCGYLAE